MRGLIVIGCCWLWSAALVFCGDSSADSPSDSVAKELRAWAEAIKVAEPVTAEAEREEAIPRLLQFYTQRNYQPVWIVDRSMSALRETLLDTLRDASAEGLCPEDYRLELITALIDKEKTPQPDAADPFLSAYLDLLLSNAFFRLAADLQVGRPVFADLLYQKPSLKKDPVKLLEQALRENSLKKVLADLRPADPGYPLLVDRLERYRQIAALDGWPKLSPGPVVHPGERDRRVPLLRTRLSSTEGDIPAPEKNPQVLDNPTVIALKAFQRRHGLSADGVLGAKTLNELNVTAEDRVRQIELNLERWRRLRRNTERRSVQVNIADQSLRLVEDGRAVMAMAVIVGTEARQTPEFSGTMSYLELAPYWYVPPTILREDKLPLIRRNPDWLREKHFEIVAGGTAATVVDPKVIDWQGVTEKNFPGVLRQLPGPWNPLGQIKFMFPNRFAVYLHDTPERHLFQERVRLFSSGCIRIERPLDLAQYLFELQGLGCKELMDGVLRDSPLRVPLKKPVPVDILYRTAWVAPDGALQFRDDVYRRDLDMTTALEFRRKGWH